MGSSYHTLHFKRAHALRLGDARLEWRSIGVVFHAEGVAACLSCMKPLNQDKTVLCDICALPVCDDNNQRCGRFESPPSTYGKNYSPFVCKFCREDPD